MYETAFGLTRRPFATTPDPGCFFPSESAQAALDALAVCIETGQGIGILTSPAGLGKTLLCRRLVAELRSELRTVFLATSSFPTRRALLQAVLYELGQPYSRMGEQELRLELQTAVRQIRLQKKGVALIIDEAHLLSERLLEEVRAITNLTDDAEPLVRVVLSGQLPLEEKLASPHLDALNQRIGCHVSLEPLTRRETVAYVKQRLDWAGGAHDGLFTPEALELVAHVCDGVPRCINQLCDHSLLLAFVAETPLVDASLVREALEDLKQLPLHWNEPPTSIPAADVPRHSAEDLLEEEIGHWADDETIDAVESLPAAGRAFEVENASTDSPENDICETVTIEVGADEEPADEIATIEGPAHGDLIHAIERGHDLCSRISPSEPEETAATGAELDDWDDRNFPTGDVFEEESVVDRYADLDARRQTSDAGIVWDIHPAASALDAVGPESTIDHRPDWSEAHDTTEDERRFDRLIDEMAPLIDQALSTTDDFDFSDDPDIDTTRTAGERSLEMSFAVEPEDEELEEELASDVLDVCLETQQLLLDRCNEVDAQRQAAEIECGFDGDYGEHEDRAVDNHGFDVVQPEESGYEIRSPLARHADSGNQATQCDTMASAAKTSASHSARRSYGRLFSELRRRQQR